MFGLSFVDRVHTSRLRVGVVCVCRVRDQRQSAVAALAISDQQHAVDRNALVQQIQQLQWQLAQGALCLRVSLFVCVCRCLYFSCMSA